MALIIGFVASSLRDNEATFTVIVINRTPNTIKLNLYGFLSTNEILTSRKKHKKDNKKYNFVSFLKNIRNLILEFGVSEVLDSFLVRPFTMYIFPLLIGNLQLGILVGKLAADVIFYIPTIIAYELRKKHLKD